MNTTADDPNFADRPWMDPEAEPTSGASARNPKSSSWSKPMAWRAASHATPLLSWIMPVLGTGIMMPLLIWQVKAKKEGDPALAKQAVEALNFQINVAVLSLLLTATVFGIALLPLLWIGASVFAIIAAVKAYRGEEYSYPWILRPIEVN